MADLEVLTKEGSYDEFFAHALDIRPSERQEAWKEMVSKVGGAFTKMIMAKSEISYDDYQKLQQLWNWPTLKIDDVFKSRRQQIALSYLKNCLKEPSPCWKEVNSYWESDSNDAETAFKLAEIVSQHPNSPLPIWKFLDIALKNSLSQFYCKKEFVMNALWAKLEVDYIRLGPKGDMLKKIDDTIHPQCLASLNQEAHKKLMTPDKLGDRELGHQILFVQTKVNQRTSDFFHTVYLLENPSQGELFNYSWNRLKELGNSSIRRDAVLELLKSLDPLPDEILTSFDKTKKRVILSHFKSHFPEYLDYYAEQCVLFYGGKSSFPQGNPTLRCQEFMNSELAPKILDPHKIKRYQEVKNI
jgi:hypothetical protein